MTPKQRAAQDLARHKAAVKGAKTRAAEVKKFQQTHHGQSPQKGQLHPAARRPRQLAGACLGTEWVLGGNDDHDSCVQTAFANSLYLLTGFRATDEDVLKLFHAAENVPLSVALESLMEHGLSGVYPFGYVEAPYLVPGAILGVSLPEPHTVVFDDDGLITWGGKIRHACVVEEAWLILWPEQEKR
jgi:hypothetical protein